MAFETVCNVAEVPTDEAWASPSVPSTWRSRVDGDEFFALQDLCSHASVALSEGEVSDCSVECWLHGSRFDLRTGKPIGPPATEPVATFPVEVRDSGVYVDISTSLNGVTPADRPVSLVCADTDFSRKREI